jgi:hypothetical protein
MNLKNTIENINISKDKFFNIKNKIWSKNYIDTTLFKNGLVVKYSQQQFKYSIVIKSFDKRQIIEGYQHLSGYGILLRSGNIHLWVYIPHDLLSYVDTIHQPVYEHYLFAL